MSSCTCVEVYVGSERTNVKNINDDCPDHGIGSEYYKGRAAFWSARLQILRNKKHGETPTDGTLEE